jgi:hypothetical protein
MEMPTSVSPVRTRRRIRPRTTTLKKVMSSLSECVHDLAVLHDQGPGCAPGDGHVVRDQHQRHLPLFVEPDNEIQNESGACAVKVACRFVRKEHRRAIGKASSYGDALPFSAG